MSEAFIGIGSNIRPAENMRDALRILGSKVRIKGISTVYLTDPIGRPEQEQYYNCVAAIETDFSPEEIRHAILRTIETNLGRVRTEDRYASRIIDLDLIVYDDLVLKTGELSLPDPQILNRPFLAMGLSELAPDLVLPGTGLTAVQTATRLGTAGMVPLPEYTEELRKEISHAVE